MATSNVVSLYTSNSPLPTPSRNATVRRPVESRSMQEPLRFTIVSTLVIALDNGEKLVPSFTFPISPNQVNIQGLGISYEELERPGRKGLMTPKSNKLGQISATFLLHSLSQPYIDHCEDEMLLLEEFANLDADLAISYPGVREDRLWRITDISFRTVRRNESNRVTMCESSITFTESRWSDSNPVVPGMAVIKDVPWTGTTNDRQRDGDSDTDLDIDVQQIINLGAGLSAASAFYGEEN